MKVIDIKPLSDAWFKWRSEGITATDACVLALKIGFAPYNQFKIEPFKTVYQLWAEKLQKAPQLDLSCNPYVRRGSQFEDDARLCLENKFGEILLPLCIESTEDPVLRASLDGFNNGIPVEIKIPSDNNFEKIEQMGENSEFYWKYYPQVQHQILVCGSKFGWLAFYSVKNKRFKLFKVLKDEMYQERMKSAYNSFKKEMINEKAPNRDPMRDSFVPDSSIEKVWKTNVDECVLIDSQIKKLTALLDKAKSEKFICQERMVDLMKEKGNFFVYRSPVLNITRHFRKGKVDHEAFINDQNTQNIKLDSEDYREKAKEGVRITVH